MRTPSHHPPAEFLLDYASGAAPEAEALLIASHLAACPACRAHVAQFEAVGGALLAAEPATAGPDPLRDRVLAALEADEARNDAPAPRARRADVPAPLAPYLPAEGPLSWKPVIGGVDEILLPTDRRKGAPVAKLMRIRAGIAMPRHTHGGYELTLVLEGGFSDPDGHYLRGDVAAGDEEVDHSPVADLDGDCVCLAVTSAPLRLTGRFLRFLNPFVRL